MIYPISKPLVELYTVPVFTSKLSYRKERRIYSHWTCSTTLYLDKQSKITPYYNDHLSYSIPSTHPFVVQYGGKIAGIDFVRINGDCAIRTLDNDFVLVSRGSILCIQNHIVKLYYSETNKNFDIFELN